MVRRSQQQPWHCVYWRDPTLLRGTTVSRELDILARVEKAPMIVCDLEAVGQCSIVCGRVYPINVVIRALEPLTQVIWGSFFVLLDNVTPDDFCMLECDQRIELSEFCAKCVDNEQIYVYTQSSHVAIGLAKRHEDARSLSGTLAELPHPE